MGRSACLQHLCIPRCDFLNGAFDSRQPVRHIVSKQDCVAYSSRSQFRRANHRLFVTATSLQQHILGSLCYENDFRVRAKRPIFRRAKLKETVCRYTLVFHQVRNYKIVGIAIPKELQSNVSQFHSVLLFSFSARRP